MYLKYNGLHVINFWHKYQIVASAFCEAYSRKCLIPKFTIRKNEIKQMQTNKQTTEIQQMSMFWLKN